MSGIKALWERFKVQISFVAGCLVVATSVGTCTFDPSQVSEEPPATEVEDAVEEASTAEVEVEAVEVNTDATVSEATEVVAD